MWREIKDSFKERSLSYIQREFNNYLKRKPEIINIKVKTQHFENPINSYEWRIEKIKIQFINDSYELYEVTKEYQQDISLLILILYQFNIFFPTGEYTFVYKKN